VHAVEFSRTKRTRNPTYIKALVRGSCETLAPIFTM
jgi:hypothetical protein